MWRRVSGPAPRMRGTVPRTGPRGPPVVPGHGRDRAAQARYRSAHLPSGAAASPTRVADWPCTDRTAGLGATKAATSLTERALP